MKSCLGMAAAVLGTVVVLGGGALLWHLSDRAEFSRRDANREDATVPPASPVPETPPSGD